jgi:hypothetical protein
MATEYAFLSLAYVENFTLRGSIVRIDFFVFVGKLTLYNQVANIVIEIFIAITVNYFQI